MNKMFRNNKKGQLTILMIFLILGLLFAAIMLFTGGIATTKINDVLNQDIPVGQVNLKNVSAVTFGQFNAMYLNSAEWWGLSVIFGLILGLFFSAYMTRNMLPKWGIIFDIFIIVAMFIVALYVSSSYSVLLDALEAAGEPFLETYTPKTSMFILNLPIFVTIIGVIMMFLFHSTIPRKREEGAQSGGILQGV